MTPEIATYLQRIDDRRSRIWKTLEDLGPEALNWKPTEKDTNSLFVLATHSIGSEHGWIAEIMAGEPRTRVRDAEFLAFGRDMDELREHFETTARETERILGGMAAHDLETTRDHPHYGHVTFRWILLHVIEHLSEHLAHMELTRQLYESQYLVKQ